MKRYSFVLAFVLGALAVIWVALAVASSHLLVLLMTGVIAGVYGLGARELQQFRHSTRALDAALLAAQTPPESLDAWLDTVPASLRQSVRLRIEGERVALPGPSLTPYLVGLLVMLGMLGTFLGMVVTLNGAVFALQGSLDIQGMREAFSEPVKGLGLAFGTSVAGVATSAMLGLMANLCRRERGLSSHTLDVLMQGALRPFTLAQQRRDTYAALQQQTQALPQVVAQLDRLMQGMQAQARQMHTQWQEGQEAFQRDNRAVYQALAQSVGDSLEHSLSHSMQLAADGIRPLVQDTMGQLSEQTRQLHAQVAATTAEQWQSLQGRIELTAQALQAHWGQALKSHEQAGQDWLSRLDRTLQALEQQHEQRHRQWLAEHQADRAQQAAARDASDEARLQRWRDSLHAQGEALQEAWQRLSEHSLSQQQALGESLQATTRQLTEQVEQHAVRSLAEVSALLRQAEDLLARHQQDQAQWSQAQQAQANEWTQHMRAELSALREQEARQAEAAVQRLGDLQTAVTDHLARLGTALEAPMGRLIETASEAPRAAAEVIGQLRQEVSAGILRDQAVLAERERIMQSLVGLLDRLQDASEEQRAFLQEAVGSTREALLASSEAFGQQLQAQHQRLADSSAQVQASALEIGSLGEALQVAVQGFGDSSQALGLHLQRLEDALGQSLSRSDDQLAYYVAQAREIIDMSLQSQKDVLEALQQRAAQGAAA